MTATVFDILLALLLVWLGWRTVASPNLFDAVILFVIFGLLMVLCWARLGAPDVALAEAAIGAGLTTALLLEAYRDLTGNDPAHVHQPDESLLRWPLAALCTLLFLGLVATGWRLEPPTELGDMVWARLADSGVENPVTAVLLNFRGYDTLLEVAVLLLALLGLWVTNQNQPSLGSRQTLDPDSALIDAMVRMLVPMAALVCSYLLWAGAHAPGGAFQAGAVLAGAGVLLHLAERVQPVGQASRFSRALAVVGLLVFVAVAAYPLAHGERLLQYPQGQAKFLILLVESALTVSIAYGLTLMFSGGRGFQRRR